MNTDLIIWILIGLVAGFYSFGTLFADLQGEYPNKSRVREDYGFCFLISCMIAIFPIAVIVPICTSGFNKNGWKLRIKE